jgi:hypothetical protein
VPESTIKPSGIAHKKALERLPNVATACLRASTQAIPILEYHASRDIEISLSPVHHFAARRNSPIYKGTFYHNGPNTLISVFVLAPIASFRAPTVWY